MNEENTFDEQDHNSRALLISWNKDNWTWEGFAEKCEATKNGYPDGINHIFSGARL